MPRFDKTGPAGAGPQTGRGQGNCVNSDADTGSAGRGMRRGFRNGMMCRGFGRGGFFSGGNISLDEKERILETQLEAVRKEKEILKKAEK